MNVKLFKLFAIFKDVVRRLPSRMTVTHTLLSRPAREPLPAMEDFDDFSVTSNSDCWGAGVIGFLLRKEGTTMCW